MGFPGAPFSAAYSYRGALGGVSHPPPRGSIVPRVDPCPPPRRVLIIRPSALGDVARSVPVLSSLRAAYPDARIDWLVQDAFADAVRFHPALTGVVEFPRRELGRAMRSLRLGVVMRWLAGLRRPGYDLVLDCQGLARSGLFAWWTRAPRRLGSADARELAPLAYTRRVPVPPGTHTVERMLSLVEALGVPALRDAAAQRLDPGDPGRAWLEAHRPPGPYVVVSPATRWPGKQWPADRFAQVARAIAARGARVAVIATAAEREAVAPLTELARSTPGVLDFVGKTPIAGLIALIDDAAAVLANDSAALHIGVAMDRPVVGLYGPTRVELAGPYRRPGDVIQHVGPADRMDYKDAVAGSRLMDRITTDEVIARLEAVARW